MASDNDDYEINVRETEWKRKEVEVAEVSQTARQANDTQKKRNIAHVITRPT